MRTSVTSLVLVLALAGGASAETLHWNDGGDRDWNNPDNWDDAEINQGVPGAEDKANVWRTPTPIINSLVPEIKNLDLGGVLDIETGGTLSVNQWLIVGYGHDDSGTLNINGGQTSTIGGADMSLGFGDVNSGAATGTVHMSGGSLRTDDLFIGRNTLGTGHLNLSGATSMVSAKNLFVGDDGTGHVTMTGGSFDLGTDLIIGDGGTGNGEMTISGGTITDFNRLAIGIRGTGKLTMNGAAATISTNGILMLGDVGGSDGTLVMENGSLTVGTLAYIGFRGTGLLDMTGGTINVPADKPMVIGRNTGSSGEVLLKGGTITAGWLEFNNEGASLLSHMDITGGTLFLAGDMTGAVDNHITAGYLTGYGRNDTLIVDYNSGTDLTKVTAQLSGFQLVITDAIAPNPGYDLTWDSKPGHLYNLWSTQDLTEELANWDLVQDDIPATGTSTTWPVDPPETALFFRVSEFPAPPLFEQDFEAGDGGFILAPTENTEGTDWAHGAPNSVGFNGQVVDSGNDGSANCWGTDIGDPGLYLDPTTDSCLRSSIIDLSGVTTAELTFAQALDFPPEDTAVINIIDVATGNPIDSPSFPHLVTDDSDADANWNPAGPFALPVGGEIRIEWCFSGTGSTTDDYMGWYIDDVKVVETTP